MKILTGCAWIIGIALMLLVILLLVAPVDVHMEQSAHIRAPDSVVWEHVTRFRKMYQWNTWRDIEPEVKFFIEGQDATPGSSVSWKGKKLGVGKLEHILLRPYTEVRQKQHLYAPFESESDVFFLLKAENGGTTVTWSVDANYPRPKNMLVLFIKNTLENDLAKGLENLKAAAERAVAETGR